MGKGFGGLDDDFVDVPPQPTAFSASPPAPRGIMRPDKPARGVGAAQMLAIVLVIAVGAVAGTDAIRRHVNTPAVAAYVQHQALDEPIVLQ